MLETLPLPHDDVLGQALLVPTDIVSDPYPSISMIPGAVTIRFDRRTVSGERLEDVLAQIRGHLAGHGLSDFTLAVSGAGWKPIRASMPRRRAGCRGGVAMADTALLAAARGRQRQWRGAAGGCLAVLHQRLGIRRTARYSDDRLGPGNEEDAHTIDESIALEQLEGARDIYRNLVLAVCG